ncbi:MAG: hypothetical protein QME68_05950, partial [Elusimicrobiota bacterium]|nr:hypothetical protein [Elusimicrobiota bacterium]
HGTGIKSDCYKVNHHGSKYSSYETFLNNLQPKYAFIQVGENRYGHPTVEAMNRINVWTSQAEEIKIERDEYKNIYRNDLDGTIFVYTTGDGKYSIQTGYIPVPSEEEQPPGGEPGAPPPTPSVKEEFIIVEARNNVFSPEKEEKVYLRYTMVDSGKISINIYTLFGELVKKDEYYESRTRMDVLKSDWSWDGTNENGQVVAPGVYLLHIQTPLKTVIKKVVVLR